ncbi:NUDIX domain-containing protein [Actinokineospora sp. 24-640]
MTTTSSALGPLVAVYGLVGHDEQLLVVHDPDTMTCRLPGGLVHAGEPVENALRRILREHLGAHIAHMDFCAAVELPGHHPDQQPALYELALLFDVTVTDPVAIHTDHGEPRWVTNTELDHLNLCPQSLAHRLRTDVLASEYPWWPTQS